MKEKLSALFKKYFSEFALIFISVILAFALTEWSSSQGEKATERKMLVEIQNGIKTDVEDFDANVRNHKISIQGVRMIRDWVNQKSMNQDSINIHYYLMYRNYSPIINKTGYESLKSTSLKTIDNDSLRFKIIKLYEYHYNIIETLENQNEETQDFKNYFGPVNKLVSPYLVFDERGNLVNLKKSSLTEQQKTELLSYLWRMEISKKFKLKRYDEVILKAKELDGLLANVLKD